MKKFLFLFIGLFSLFLINNYNVFALSDVSIKNNYFDLISSRIYTDTDPNSPGSLFYQSIYDGSTNVVVNGVNKVLYYKDSKFLNYSSSSNTIYFADKSFVAISSSRFTSNNFGFSYFDNYNTGHGIILNGYYFSYKINDNYNFYFLDSTKLNNYVFAYDFSNYDHVDVNGYRIFTDLHYKDVNSINSNVYSNSYFGCLNGISLNLKKLPYQLGSAVSPVETLDYDSILSLFSNRLSESGYTFSDFTYHVIYQDVNTSDLSNGTYHIAFFHYDTDFQFSDLPADNSGKAHSTASQLYYIYKKESSNSVCEISFNSLDDIKSGDFTCSPTTYKESKGDYFQVLWTDNPISLFYKTWTGAWNSKILYNLCSSFNSFDSSISLKYGDSVLLLPTLTYSYNSSYAVNNVFWASWITFDNLGNYKLVPNTSMSLSEWFNQTDIVNYKSSYKLPIYQSYIDNNYFFLLSNRNKDISLTFWYNSSDFNVVIFNSSDTNKSFVYNSLSFNVNNPNESFISDMESSLGSYKPGDYTEGDRDYLSSIGLNNSSSSILSIINNAIGSLTDFFSSFSLLGDIMSSFLNSMPPLFASGLYAVFSLGIILLIIKIIL